jgi:hypothetical protein
MESRISYAKVAPGVFVSILSRSAPFKMGPATFRIRNVRTPGIGARAVLNNLTM